MRTIVTSAELSRKTSDERFEIALRAAVSKRRKETTRSFLTADDGSRLIRIRSGEDRITLVIDNKCHNEFAEYLVAELPEIYARLKCAQWRNSVSSQPQHRSSTQAKEKGPRNVAVPEALLIV